MFLVAQLNTNLTLAQKGKLETRIFDLHLQNQEREIFGDNNRFT
jgi:hypothetical protein